MTMHEFLLNAAEGWTVVAAIILAIMVALTMHEEWTADEDGNRLEVVVMAALIVAGIYWFGFRP